MKLQSYLERMDIRYALTHYEQSAFTAQDVAHVTHTSGNRVIKPVVVEADGQLVMCALPASFKVDLEALQASLEATDMRLIDEATLRQTFGDCELGAEPPIGAIFGMPTIMDSSLEAQPFVTFQAGTHHDAVTLSLADYRRVAQPGIGNFGRRA